MPMIIQRFLIAVASFLIVGLLAATGRFSLPPESAALKTRPGVELANSQCLLCHSADYISTQPRLSTAQWRSVVVKMQTKYGAPVATNQIDNLADYFARNYGVRAATNTAPAAK